MISLSRFINICFKRGDQFIVMYFIHCCIIIPNHSIQRSSKIMENIGEELIFGLQRFLNYLMFLTLLRSDRRVNIHFLSFYLIFSGLIHNILLLPSTHIYSVLPVLALIPRNEFIANLESLCLLVFLKWGKRKILD